VEGSYR
jgi:hypothetical protein